MHEFQWWWGGGCNLLTLQFLDNFRVDWVRGGGGHAQSHAINCQRKMNRFSPYQFMMDRVWRLISDLWPKVHRQQTAGNTKEKRVGGNQIKNKRPSLSLSPVASASASQRIHRHVKFNRANPALHTTLNCQNVQQISPPPFLLFLISTQIPDDGTGFTGIAGTRFTPHRVE